MLLPVADVYVACISATICWALALGIPVVNYDCYRYRYDDYAGTRRVWTVENSSAFGVALRETLNGLAGDNAAPAATQFDCERWGVIDGRFFDRFIEVLDQVRAKNQMGLARDSLNKKKRYL